MKRVICDTCGSQSEPNEYGLPPAPWLSISWRKDFKTGDFCSAPCAVKALTPLPVLPAEPVVDHEVARMHDEGNPNDEVVF